MFADAARGFLRLAQAHVGTSLLSVGVPVLAVAEHRRRCEEEQPAPVLARPGSRESRVLQVAARIYCGRGLDPNACSEHVTFEDPVARCCGRAEVAEAFRALHACRPEHVCKPWIASVDDESVTVRLHQRYFGWLEVRSVLHVSCEASGGGGLITGFEERWNGAQLVSLKVLGAPSGALTRWLALLPDVPVFCRRLNGLVSYMLTPLVT